MSNSIPLVVINRLTGTSFEEKVWGDKWLRLLYGDTFLSRSLGRLLLHAIVRWPPISWLVGKYYSSARSRKLIVPFCAYFGVDTNEQTLPLDSYTSFNDFFTRRLKPESRPQNRDPSVITMPADGRYTFIPVLDETSVLSVKGAALSLDKILGSSQMAAPFYGGVGVLCRLCPSDYHRFVFPTDGFVREPLWIHGSLFSVNPIATKRFPWIFWANRRAVTLIDFPEGSTMAYVEIGATNCGTIVQEFASQSWVKKGQEKGFFQLGGSAILLLFEPGVVELAPDLLELSKSGHEIFCMIGQELARKKESLCPI